MDTFGFTFKQQKQLHALARLWAGNATDDDFEVLCDLTCDISDLIMKRFEHFRDKEKVN